MYIYCTEITSISVCINQKKMLCTHMIISYLLTCWLIAFGFCPRLQSGLNHWIPLEEIQFLRSPFWPRYQFFKATIWNPHIQEASAATGMSDYAEVWQAGTYYGPYDSSRKRLARQEMRGNAALIATFFRRILITINTEDSRVIFDVTYYRPCNVQPQGTPHVCQKQKSLSLYNQQSRQGRITVFLRP